MTWNWLTLELRPHDALLVPTLGPGGYTRDQAHAVILATLTAAARATPALRPLIAQWQGGAKDDTVYAGTLTWAIYEHPDPQVGADEWIADYAALLRSAGLTVGIAKP